MAGVVVSFKATVSHVALASLVNVKFENAAPVVTRATFTLGGMAILGPGPAASLATSPSRPACWDGVGTGSIKTVEEIFVTGFPVSGSMAIAGAVVPCEVDGLNWPMVLNGGALPSGGLLSNADRSVLDTSRPVSNPVWFVI